MRWEGKLNVVILRKADISYHIPAAQSARGYFSEPLMIQHGSPIKWPESLPKLDKNQIAFCKVDSGFDCDKWSSTMDTGQHLCRSHDIAAPTALSVKWHNLIVCKYRELRSICVYLWLSIKIFLLENDHTSVSVGHNSSKFEKSLRLCRQK